MVSKCHEAESQGRKLSAPDEGGVADAWRVEFDSRWHEIENGTAVTMPAAEVFANDRNALK